MHVQATEPLEGAALKRTCAMAGLQRLRSQTCCVQVFADNYLDGGYHVAFAHPSLAADLDLRGYTSRLYERVSIQSAPPRPGSSGSDRMGAYSACSEAVVHVE